MESIFRGQPHFESVTDLCSKKCFCIKTTCHQFKVDVEKCAQLTDLSRLKREFPLFLRSIDWRAERTAGVVSQDVLQVLSPDKLRYTRLWVPPPTAISRK